MDALQRCETSYTDALRPVQRDTINSFMGEHALTQPATYYDLQQFMSMVVSAINSSAATYAALLPAPVSQNPASHHPVQAPYAALPLLPAAPPGPAAPSQPDPRPST